MRLGGATRRSRWAPKECAHACERPGQFNTPHAIAIDREDNGYVGDRANHRIQVFDTDGNFKSMFSIDVPPDPASRPFNGATPTGEALARAIGAPNSICITPGSPQVLFVGASTYPGRIFKVALDGTVLGGGGSRFVHRMTAKSCS